MAEVGGLFKKKAGKKKKTISISDETIKNAYEKEHIDADKLSTGLSSVAIDTDGWTDQGEAAKKKAVITLGKKLVPNALKVRTCRTPRESSEGVAEDVTSRHVTSRREEERSRPSFSSWRRARPRGFETEGAHHPLSRTGEQRTDERPLSRTGQSARSARALSFSLSLSLSLA